MIEDFKSYFFPKKIVRITDFHFNMPSPDFPNGNIGVNLDTDIEVSQSENLLFIKSVKKCVFSPDNFFIFDCTFEIVMSIMPDKLENFSKFTIDDLGKAIESDKSIIDYELNAKLSMLIAQITGFNGNYPMIVNFV